VQSWPPFTKPRRPLLGGGVHVRVLEDDERGLAAELEVDPFDRLRRALEDLPPGGGVSGEAHHVDLRAPDEGLPDHAARSRDHVHDARREPRLLDELRELDRREGVRLAGLRTAVFPAASAGPSFQTAIISG